MAEEQRGNLQGKIAADSTMLTAIGETQSKHSLQLNVIEGKIDVLGGKVDVIEGKVDVIEGKLDRLGRGQEALQAEMVMVKGGQETLQTDMVTVKGRLDKIDEKLDLLLSK
jgi:hypothetical protein